MIKRKSKLKLISGLITAIMMFNSLSALSAPYNGTSGASNWAPTGGGTSSSGDSLVNFKNQMIKCSLYFCPMDGVTMDGTQESRDEMDAKWAEGSGIQQVGQSIYIGRDDVSVTGGSYYKGDIASVDLMEKEQREFKIANTPFYTASSLGFENPNKLPIFITNGGKLDAGIDIVNYFMIKRSDYEEGKTSPYDIKENMRKLIHAISGINARTGLYDVSFSRSELGDPLFDSDSDFDSGLYQGQLGEYKLYLESCMVIGTSQSGSTAMTVRDAMYKGFVDGPNASERAANQPNTMNHIGQGLYLNSNDTFGIKKATDDKTGELITKSKFSDLKTAINKDMGYGVNILSSELFRDPKTRSIGSHVNVFLPLDAGFTAIDDSYAAKWSREGTQNTGVAAIGMEYIGNKVSEETLYKEALKFFNNMSSAQKLKETISNQIESGVATNDPTLYELNNRRNHFLDEATNYMEEIDDASKIAKLYRSFDERAFADAYSQTIELISYGEVKRGYSTKSLELFNYVNGLQKSGTIASFDGTINDRKWLNGSIILDSNAKDETVLEQAANQDSFVYSSNVLNALDNSTQLVVNTEWENTINKINYEYATEMSPIVSGETMLTVFNNSMQSAQLPKGLVKDMSTMLLSDLGELVNNKVENARRAIYGGEYFNTYKDNSSDIDDMILNYLGGGIDDSFSQSNDHGDVSGDGLYVEYPGEWVKEALPSATNNTLLSSYLPSIYNGQGLYDYPIVNVNKVEDASYGSVQNGDIHAVNVDVLGVNHALEAAISLAPYGGYRIMKPTSWIEQGYATGLRGFRNHLTGTVIIPSRWLSSIDNKTETEVIAEASENAVIESKNYYDATNSGRMTHVVSEAITAIDDLQAVQDIAGGVPNTPSTDGNFIQSTSNSKLNTILPEENSEIGDRGWGRIGLKGNYAISYDIYDRSIPVDVVMVFRDSEGNIIPSTPVNGTEKTLAYWFNVYNVNPGIEKVLDIQEEFLMPGKNNEEFRVIPKEAIIKPAYISLYDFLSQMNSMEGDKLEFKHDNLDVVTKLEKAPFEVNLGSGAREIRSKSEGIEDSLSGTPTVLDNNGIVKNAISMVATNKDEEAYLDNKAENRMALVLVVDVEYNIDQYNVIDFIEDGKKTTIVEKVKPQYTEDDTGIRLEQTRTDAQGRSARMVGWKTSVENKQPESWSNVTALSKHLGDEYPTEVIPQSKDECYNIYVHYVYEDTTTEVVNSIELSQKRISQVRNLSNPLTGSGQLGLGVAPTIKFSWYAADASECCGEHDDDYDCDDCCFERLADKDYTLVSTNTKALDAEIIGTTTGFYPFDSNNAKSGNRTTDADTYLMSPEYTFTTWRGNDIPVLAEYKYSEGSSILSTLFTSTGQELSTIYNRAGNSTRNANNGSQYTDEFTILEGKADVDTNSLASFSDVYGNGNLTAAQKAFKKAVSQYEDNCEELHDKQEKEYKKLEDEVSEAKSYMNKCKNYRAKARYSSSGYYMGGSYSYWDNEYDWAEEEYYEKVAELDELEAEIEELEAEIEAYKETLKADKNKAGNVADYKYSTYMSRCKDFLGFDEILGNSIQYRTQIKVNVYYGEPNFGSASVADYYSQNLKAYGLDYKNVKGTPIVNDVNIKYWPYVEMLYDTTDLSSGSLSGLNQTVNVLGGHESEFKPNDYVEVGYLTAKDRGITFNNDNGTGLKVEAQQWSTHASAKVLAQKLGVSTTDAILPGGAIFRLRTPSSAGVVGGADSGRTKVAISSWFTFIPEDTENAVTAGATTYSSATASQRHTDMVNSIKNSLDQLDIIMNVNGTDIRDGVNQVPGTSSAKTKLSLGDDGKKYWLSRGSAVGSNEANQADLDIVSEDSSEVTYYRVYSDVYGNVYVRKSTTSQQDTKPIYGNVGENGIIGKLAKTNSDYNSWIESNTEMAALDHRTKLITNFVNSIDRNKGWDATLANEADYTWYNEAFDGICVKRVNTVLELGFKDGVDGEANLNNVARTAVIDPKLQPERKSQSDIYSTGVKAYFHSEYYTNNNKSDNGLIGIRKNSSGTDVKIYIPKMEDMFQSKTFGIPNISVMDLY